MNALASIAAERLVGVTPYRPGKPPPGSMAGKLSANESGWGPGPRVVSALEKASRGVGYYPREDSLLAAVTQAYGVAEGSVLVTNGSDELCTLVATVFLGSDRTCVVGDPCYAIDASASLMSGARVVRVPLLMGAHDLDAMAEAAQAADVVWLPTPHNPTGVAIPTDALHAFIAKVPQHCLVVVDMAYVDFADPHYRVAPAELLARHPHVLVQKTLSKAQALAGLRVGLAFAAPEVTAALRSVRLPFSVNSLGAAAAEAAVREPAWSQMIAARVREGREALQCELDRLGVEYLPSQANFVLAHLDHERLREPLARHGISVRSGDDLGIPGWTRITVGWSPMMAELRRGLREALSTSTNATTTEGAA